MRDLARRLYPDQAGQRLLRHSEEQFQRGGVSDLHFSERSEEAQPQTVLEKLRWGGQLVFLTSRSREAEALVRTYERRPEFCVDQPVQAIEGNRRLRWGRFRRPGRYYFLARKVLLDKPENLLTRHSFDVRLTRGSTEDHAWDHYLVTKQVPTLDQTTGRMLQLMGADQLGQATRAARKLVNKVFPALLSREAAFLKILARDMPPALRARVPQVLDLEHDQRGLVNRIDMTWLRLGGQPISTLRFARQATELLDAVHRQAGIVHLDLRLDNMLITEGGVGLVDFGSAMRLGEDLGKNPMLETLVDEMLSGSRIRRDLNKLQRRGKVTSSVFEGCYQRRDTAVDLFALALQMTRPEANAEFRGLLRDDLDQSHLDRLTRLQRHVLRPANPRNPTLRTVSQLRQVLNGQVPLRMESPSEPLPTTDIDNKPRSENQPFASSPMDLCRRALGSSA